VRIGGYSDKNELATLMNVMDEVVEADERLMEMMGDDGR
jgi:hypothetical protein